MTRCRRCGVQLRDFYHPGPALEDCPSAAVLRQEAYFAELEFERRMQAIEARDEAAAETYYSVDRDMDSPRIRSSGMVIAGPNPLGQARISSAV